MLDLSRVKQKEKITITLQDKYPTTPVLTVLASEDGKNPTVHLNNDAMRMMEVSDDANRLIMFPEYNISQTDDAEYDSVIGIVKDARVDGPNKKYTSYGIHMKTQRVKSTVIYNEIVNLFELDTMIDNEFEINSISDLAGAFTLSPMVNVVDAEIEVEVDFNKGEGLLIEQE